MRLSDAIAVHVGGLTATAVYLGPNLIWEPDNEVPSGPPVTSGLLWYNKTPIDYTKTGPHVPPIPVPRSAGPVYCAISVRVDAADGVIFRIGNPGDYYHEQNTFQLEHNGDDEWGDTYHLNIAPGWPNQVIGEIPPGDPDELLLEFWLSPSGSDFVDHQQYSWVNADMPASNVAASSHLFIGYRLEDTVNVLNRGEGRIDRMVIYDRVPSPAERTQIMGWVANVPPPPPLPPVTSGLLWHTNDPITFTETGPHVPAISMPRAAGPLYVVINYDQAVTADEEPAIFYIGNPSDNLYTTNTFHVYRNWGNGIGVSTTPGRGMMVGLNQPPTNFIGEIWASSSGSNMVDYVTPATSWYMDPIPNHNPASTSHLFLGYKPDGSNAAWRGEGTINKMAIFDRIPTPSERNELTAWVQS